MKTMKGLWRVGFVQKCIPFPRMMSSQHDILYSTERTRRIRKPSFVENRKSHHKEDLIISCKNEQLNHYKGQTYNKFAVVPLASNGWHHRKSKGDFFEIKNYGDKPAVDENEKMSFQSLNISSDIVHVLQDNGISEPTHIQEDGIKHVLKGHNTLLAAETGSGKTLAYLLPLLTQICLYRSSISREKMNSPFGLIITPSRELAHQIGENAKMICERIGINATVVTGGGTKKMILSPSFEEVDLLVASLGALSKLITTGIYRTSHVQHVVLDEADTLLDDSFNGKLLYLLRRFSFLPVDSNVSSEKPRVQITMASATIPTSMNEILGQIIPMSTLHRVTSKHLHCIQPHVPQKFIRVGRSEKPAVLLRIAKANAERHDPLLIFSNKTPTCDWISLFLNENNIKCTNLNGDMHYNLRIGKFKEFQTGIVNVISCTDMGSRGLDTVRAQHVLNYDFPIYMADYIHRCGRTGRIGSPKNCHITHFITGESEIELLKKIESAVRRGESLPNVNANIRKIIQHRYQSHMM